MKLLDSGDWISSPGGSFSYEILGPVCVLFDREELPWPCCRISWKGKEPSWRRIGPRYVADLAARRCHSYSVIGHDSWGNKWQQVLTMYNERLDNETQRWWYWKAVPNQSPPEFK